VNSVRFIMAAIELRRTAGRYVSRAARDRPGTRLFDPDKGGPEASLQGDAHDYATSRTRPAAAGAGDAS
jgi:hypothetical protein